MKLGKIRAFFNNLEVNIYHMFHKRKVRELTPEEIRQYKEAITK